MINEGVREIAQRELGSEEEILWVGQSDINIVRKKAILIQLFVIFIMAIITGIVLFSQPRTIGLIDIIPVAVIVVGVLVWQTRKALKVAATSVENIYALTPNEFIILRSLEESNTFNTERVPYGEIKHVHRMSIANGESVTLVLKGGLIPNLSSIIIDGLEKETPLYKIVKQKVNYI